jgi:catechol 2,3-dioxygenase-like lactoylglutathione lyase family enzyme
VVLDEHRNVRASSSPGTTGIGDAPTRPLYDSEGRLIGYLASHHTPNCPCGGGQGCGRTSLPSMRMLHLGLRVTDLERSLRFYTALGYTELGAVPQTQFGSLTMLKLPDDPFVSLELVHDPTKPVQDIRAVNHLVVQVDDLHAVVADLATKGVTAEQPTEPGPGMWTSWLTDPDGYRIELVQWPPGHPAGMTAADFA